MVAVTLSTKALKPALLLYDSAAGVSGVDANTSRVVRAPAYISIEGMDDVNLTSVKVQVKIHPDGVWHDFIDIDTTVANALVEFTEPPNFARVLRDGTDDYKVYAQVPEGL